MKHLRKIWKDQEDFNSLFFSTPENWEQRSAQTKEFLIHLMSEMDELLRCTEWKIHRKNEALPNPEQVKNEITDIFKYFISLCIVWGIRPEDLVKDYWRKSMVCRQRYSQEFCQTLDGKMVLIDIDGVLADYVKGVLNWLEKNHPDLESNVRAVRDAGSVWVGSISLGLDDQRWKELKHEFRVTRGKLTLPLVDGAKDLLDWCRSRGYKIVLLTSRPIDMYPNLYTETLEWLQNNGLTFDFLWWSSDKGESVLSKDIRNKVGFAVDDDERYVKSYRSIGITTHHITSQFTVRDLVTLLTLSEKELP